MDANEVQVEVRHDRPSDLRVVDTLTFEDVYRRHYPRMVRVAYALTGSNETAEDVVQDAYVKLYARFADLSDPVPYLYRTVVNGCRERHRRDQVARRFQHLFTPSPVLPGEADETLAALSRLSPRRRAAVVLRYYADLSLAEVADVLDCKIGTLKSMLHRALNELKGVIGP